MRLFFKIFNFFGGFLGWRLFVTRKPKNSVILSTDTGNKKVSISQIRAERLFPPAVRFALLIDGFAQHTKTQKKILKKISGRVCSGVSTLTSRPLQEDVGHFLFGVRAAKTAPIVDKVLRVSSHL